MHETESAAVLAPPDFPGFRTGERGIGQLDVGIADVRARTAWDVEYHEAAPGLDLVPGEGVAHGVGTGPQAAVLGSVLDDRELLHLAFVDPLGEQFRGVRRPLHLGGMPALQALNRDVGDASAELGSVPPAILAVRGEPDVGLAVGRAHPEVVVLVVGGPAAVR